jgi:hypothetical protein
MLIRPAHSRDHALRLPAARRRKPTADAALACERADLPGLAAVWELVTATYFVTV